MYFLLCGGPVCLETDRLSESIGQGLAGLAKTSSSSSSETSLLSTTSSSFTSSIVTSLSEGSNNSSTTVYVGIAKSKKE